MPPPPFKLTSPWKVRQFSLNFKHVFSLEYLYKRIHEWLVEEGYCMGGDNWIEKLYLERVDSGGGKQIWIWWRTDKMYPPMGAKFFKFYLDVDFHVLNLKNEEIVVNGKKVKTNKGECEVFVTAKMEIDPAGEWEQNFILKNRYIQKFYLNRMYKSQIEKAEDMLVRDAARLLGAIKQYYQLESWLPEYAEEAFHAEKGE